jgi:hypothetical protein
MIDSVQPWLQVMLEGEVSGDGSPYGVYIRRGGTNRLLVVFQGGGISWNQHTAASPIVFQPSGQSETTRETYYITSIPTGQMRQSGILDSVDPRNPFRDWNAINIPYTTADLFLGNNDYPYQNNDGQPAILYHHGLRNVDAVLKALKTAFPETPESILIVGISAGGYGCLVAAPAIQRLYPGCDSYVIYSDGTHFNTSCWPQITEEVWKTNREIQSQIKSRNLINDLFSYTAQKMPLGTVFLHSNTLWDKMLVMLMNKMNHDRMQVDQDGLNEYHDTLTDAVKELHETLGNYWFYLADHPLVDQTTPHTFSGNSELLYTELTEGYSPISWLEQAVLLNPGSVGHGLL